MSGSAMDQDEQDLTWDPDLQAISQEATSQNATAQQAAAKRIVKRCRKSPAALTNYCRCVHPLPALRPSAAPSRCGLPFFGRMGILDVLAPALCRSVAKEEDWKGTATTSIQLIDVSLAVSRLLFEGHPAPKEKKERPLVRAQTLRTKIRAVALSHWGSRPQRCWASRTALG